VSLLICNSAALDPETPLRLSLPSGRFVAVYKVGEQIFVTDDLCTHGDASLAEGMLDGYEIECPYHMGRFDIRTGEPTLAPCREPVRTYQASIIDGGVYISVDE
jgi:nitrite reductase/ring-hydroxylating ferredoxin subunit